MPKRSRPKACRRTPTIEPGLNLGDLNNWIAADMDTVVNAFSFSHEYLRAALLVSLLSVWVLVVLFYYLNRFTKRDYFTAWTAAWLFYALWLTLNLQSGKVLQSGLSFSLAQCSVAASSVFLFWGSLLFLKMEVRQMQLGLFMLFVIVWSLVGPELTAGDLQLELPVFILIGTGSVFAAVSFYRFRRKMPFVGAGMLTIGFLLWGIYLTSYPLTRQYDNLFSAGFFMAAVIQLFIAVSMVVLVLEEARLLSQEALEQIEMINAEKESLQLKVITAEEAARGLYDQVRASEGKQKAYEQLRETRDVIVRQERLRAIGQMTSGLVHDLNNLLTPITGYAELLQTLPPTLPEKQKAMVGKIQKSADDIASIVRRMRDFHRPRSHEDQVELVNANKAVEEVVELTRPRWRHFSQQQGAAVVVECDLEHGLPQLTSDASELRQALTNLVFNSLDSLPKGATDRRITISTRTVELKPDGDDSVSGPAIQIEVRDNGVGMDDETRIRCLEPFFSTKVDRGGTGLGLAMVYGMVQRQRGQIDVESAVGKGTCVRLILPVENGVKLKSPVSASGGAQSLPAPLRVLYLDDEPMVRSVIGDCLKSLNHDVTVSSNGEAALQVFNTAIQEAKPFDAVITDLSMPGINGIDFSRAIKASTPSTPVILLTGWTGRDLANNEYKQVVDGVLAKPVSLKDLNDMLHRVTHGIAGLAARAA